MNDFGEALVIIEGGRPVVRRADDRIAVSRELFELIGAPEVHLPLADFGPEGTFLLAGDPSYPYVKVEDRGELIICERVKA